MLNPFKWLNKSAFINLVSSWGVDTKILGNYRMYNPNVYGIYHIKEICYAWGRNILFDVLTNSIKMNGEFFPQSPSLYNFLHGLQCFFSISKPTLCFQFYHSGPGREKKRIVYLVGMLIPQIWESIHTCRWRQKSYSCTDFMQEWYFMQVLCSHSRHTYYQLYKVDETKKPVPYSSSCNRMSQVWMYFPHPRCELERASLRILFKLASWNGLKLCLSDHWLGSGFLSYPSRPFKEASRMKSKTPSMKSKVSPVASWKSTLGTWCEIVSTSF